MKMTKDEAIKFLETRSCLDCAARACSPYYCECVSCPLAKAVKVAIKALKDIQKYEDNH